MGKGRGRNKSRRRQTGNVEPATNIATAEWEPKRQTTHGREPRWGVRATIALVALAVSASGIYAGYRLNWSIQARREALQTSAIGYAFFVDPAPIPGETFEGTSRWEVKIMVFNSGPADAHTVVMNLHTPPPMMFLHSAPTVMSDPAAAHVEIKERLPEGNYQIVIEKFIKGDSMFFHMFYRTRDTQRSEFMETWKSGGMLDSAFAKRFIGEFFFSGEHLTTHNFGAIELEPLGGTKDEQS